MRQGEKSTKLKRRIKNSFHSKTKDMSIVLVMFNSKTGSTSDNCQARSRQKDDSIIFNCICFASHSFSISLRSKEEAARPEAERRIRRIHGRKHEMNWGEPWGVWGMTLGPRQNFCHRRCKQRVLCSLTKHIFSEHWTFKLQLLAINRHAYGSSMQRPSGRAIQGKGAALQRIVSAIVSFQSIAMRSQPGQGFTWKKGSEAQPSQRCPHGFVGISSLDVFWIAQGRQKGPILWWNCQATNSSWASFVLPASCMVLLRSSVPAQKSSSNRPDHDACEQANDAPNDYAQACADWSASISNSHLLNIFESIYIYILILWCYWDSQSQSDRPSVPWSAAHTMGWKRACRCLAYQTSP